MPPSPFGNQIASGSGTTASPFGSSFGSPLGSDNGLNSVDGLLSMAQAQGGAVGAAADEMVHPTTNILSTIGDGFKNAFQDFVNVISTPSQVVAGTINDVKNGGGLIQNIGDAISNNISPADALFGKEDPNNNGMQKVGSFLTRTATNVLLDPLTYLTFGAGEGLFGMRAASEITLGEGAAAAVGKATGDVATLSGEGQKAYGFLQKVVSQVRGTTGAEIVKSGNPDLDLAGADLAKLLQGTVDAPLDPDFAKQAMSRMLEKNPALAETLLDKGGIKFFGKSVLSGQRIASVMATVPGMTMLDQVTKPLRMAIQAPFNPNLIKVGGQWTRLPPEYIDAVQNFKDLAGAWQGKAVGDIQNIIKANKLTTNESNFLTSAIEAGYRPADDRLANAWDGFFKLGNDQYKMMRDAGIPVSYLNNYVPHMLMKEDVTSLPFKMPPSAAAGAAIHRTMEGPIFNASHEDLANIEQELVKGKEAGTSQDAASQMLQAHKNDGFNIFDDNVARAWVARSADNIRATTGRYFSKNIAESFGVPASVGKAVGYVPIDSKAIKNASEDFAQKVFGKEGEEMVYHPAIAQHIQNFMGSVINDDSMKDSLQTFDKLQNFWKASVTSYFPAFHGRNAISNVLQNFLDLGVHALNPMYHFQAGSLINDNRIAEGLRADVAAGKDGAAQQLTELMNKKYFTDANGNDWNFGELSTMAKNHNIAFSHASGITSSDLATQTKLLFPESSGLGQAKQFLTQTVNPLSSNNKAVQVGTAFGGMVEDQARLVNFMANLRNTGDVTLAAKRTKQFLFDYGNLTNFEKTVAKRLMPFYTYTRKNIELQVRSLLSTPGRVSAQVQALGTLGEVLSGGQQLSKDEYTALPDWMKSGIGILTKKNGEIVTMLSSLGTPIEQPFQALQANQLLGSLSPIIRLPLEQMEGYSLFQGKPLSDVTNATAYVHAPQVLKDFIGYTSITGHRSDGTPVQLNVALNPSNMNILNNLPPFTRILGSLKQMQAVDVSGQAKILQQLIGIKPYSFDLVQENQKQQDAMKAQLQQLLTQAGITAQYQTTYIPKSQKFNLGQ